jgi:hypothetical protein
MTENELANLKIARKWLDLSTGREHALVLIDSLIVDAERERDAKKADQHGEGR